MSYQVHITSTAEHDIMRAADYIEFTLKNPTAADNLLDVATEQIGSLADLPQKFRLVDDPVLASWGIRFAISPIRAMLPLAQKALLHLL